MSKEPKSDYERGYDDGSRGRDKSVINKSFAYNRGYFDGNKDLVRHLLSGEVSLSDLTIAS